MSTDVISPEAIVSQASLVYPPQSVTVTATVTDPDGQVWANAGWIATLVSYRTSPTYADGTHVNVAVSGTLNASGVLSTTLPSNASILPQTTQWQFTIYPLVATKPLVIPPFVIPNQSSFDLTSFINQFITKPRFVLTPAPNFGYADGEVSPAPVAGDSIGQYVNVLSGPRYWNGVQWVAGNIAPTSVVTNPTGSQTISQLAGTNFTINEGSVNFTVNSINGASCPYFVTGGTTLESSGLYIGSGSNLFFTSNNSPNSPPDVTISRQAPGILQIGSGTTANDLGTLNLQTVVLTQDPTSAMQATTKEYVDTAINNIAPAGSVLVNYNVIGPAGTTLLGCEITTTYPFYLVYWRIAQAGSNYTDSQLYLLGNSGDAPNAGDVWTCSCTSVNSDASSTTKGFVVCTGSINYKAPLLSVVNNNNLFHNGYAYLDVTGLNPIYGTPAHPGIYLTGQQLSWGQNTDTTQTYEYPSQFTCRLTTNAASRVLNQISISLVSGALMTQGSMIMILGFPITSGVAKLP